MNLSIRKHLVIAGVASLALGATSAGAWAGSNSTVPVTVAVVNGTRTLTVTDPTGAAINGANPLPLGTGHGGAFLANVTDLAYSHVGYQVSATMTDLYPYSGSAYDFNGTPIRSSRISVGYPGSLTDLLNIKGVVTPVVGLTGDLSGIVGGLGLPTLTTTIDTTVDGAATTTQNLIDKMGVGNYAANLLPVTLQTGETGAFTSPAGLPGQSGTFTPTSKVLMTGTANNPTAALLSSLQNQYSSATAQDLIDAGVVDQNAVLSAVAAQLGITTTSLTAGQISSILTTLSATIDSISGILGQSGSYNTLPALTVSVPSTQPAGVYRGELTVTLMDQ